MEASECGRNVVHFMERTTSHIACKRTPIVILWLLGSVRRLLERAGALAADFYRSFARLVLMETSSSNHKHNGLLCLLTGVSLAGVLAR